MSNFSILRSDSNSFGNRKHTTATFDQCVGETVIVDDSDIKDFVSGLNRSNSGILDSICKTILVLVNKDVKDTVMPDALLDNLTDAITLLESIFIDTIFEPSFKHDKSMVSLAFNSNIFLEITMYPIMTIIIIIIYRSC
jgi:hypothetical protein